jgi:hypothetical protein
VKAILKNSNQIDDKSADTRILLDGERERERESSDKLRINFIKIAYARQIKKITMMYHY